MKNILWLSIAVIYLRYILGSALVFASIIKIKGLRFTTESGALNPIDSAWHFFETMYQSGLYWQVIGLSQLVAGALLMTQRYAKLGAIISLPILFNIFIITFSYYFALTPLITGVMLTANLLLIIWDWNSFKVLVNTVPKNESVGFERNIVWELTGLALFLYTAIYRILVDGYNLWSWLIMMFLIGCTGFLIYLFRYRNKPDISSKQIDI